MADPCAFAVGFTNIADSLRKNALKPHFVYLPYVLRHKWYVFWACRRLNVSLWQAFWHDWDKFLPGPWLAYVETFYTRDGRSRYLETPAFTYAWNAHQKRNKHHWQYWLLTWDRGETVPLEIPEKHVREMVADWIGAGLAKNGQGDPRPWYTENGSEMILHPATRQMVEQLLANLEF